MHQERVQQEIEEFSREKVTVRKKLSTLCLVSDSVSKKSFLLLSKLMIVYPPRQRIDSSTDLSIVIHS